MLFRKRPNIPKPASVFESRTEVWRQVGLGEQVDRGQAQRARGAAIVIVALIVGGPDRLRAPQAAVPGRRHPGEGRDRRRARGPRLGAGRTARARHRAGALPPARPGTAGTVGFLVRLLAIAGMLIVALRVAGLDAGALAVGGAFTAVVLGSRRAADARQPVRRASSC